MTEPDSDPVCRPWIVRALRQRPKLVNIEAREEFLAQLEQNICERRKPSNMASRLSRIGIRSAEAPMETAAGEAVRGSLERANGSVFRRL